MPSYIVTYDIHDQDIAEFCLGNMEDGSINHGAMLAASTYAVTSSAATADHLYNEITQRFTFDFVRASNPNRLAVVQVCQPPGVTITRSSIKDLATEHLFEPCPGPAYPTPLRYNAH